MTTTAPGHAPVTATAAQRNRVRLRWLLILVAALLLACLLSLAVGAHPIPLRTVWDALVNPDGSEDHLRVRGLRVPRTVLGLLVGMALGAAGALIQGHTRNPLADPGLLGVNQGAAFGVVLAVVVIGTNNLYAFIWFAFAGALLASVAVFLLGAIGGRGSTPLTLTLAGAAITALLHGLVSAIVLSNNRGMETYRFWRVGSIAARDYGVAGQIAPFLAVGLLLAFINAHGMNTLALGNDVAAALGANVRRTRALGVVAITLLTGAAVAACGPIAFLGLIVPHLARAITGPDYRWLVPVSSVCGAILLLVADVLGRVVSSDSFEVGIMLAVIGTPIFIVLVRGKGVARL